VLELIRGVHTPEGGTALRVYGNLTHEVQAFTLPCPAVEALLFSSEARKYNGARYSTTMEHLQPSECVVIGPAHWHSLWEA
jgi:hypothetical protein